MNCIKSIIQTRFDAFCCTARIPKLCIQSPTNIHIRCKFDIFILITKTNKIDKTSSFQLINCKIAIAFLRLHGLHCFNKINCLIWNSARRKILHHDWISSDRSLFGSSSSIQFLKPRRFDLKRYFIWTSRFGVRD